MQDAPGRERGGFLGDIHDRALKQAGIPLLIKVSQQAKSLIIERGTDLRFGARPLRRAMGKELVDPISRLIASQKLHAGDVVEVETDSHELVFYRNSRIYGATSLRAALF